MKELFVGVALAAIAAIVLPAVAQTEMPKQQQPSAQQSQQNEPGTGGRSKAGVEGLPGNKSGPAAEPGGDVDQPGTDAPDDAAGSDNAKVPGLPGNKSGPAEKSPK